MGSARRTAGTDGEGLIHNRLFRKGLARCFMNNKQVEIALK
jgi:hypothetical protein